MQIGSGCLCVSHREISYKHSVYYILRGLLDAGLFIHTALDSGVQRILPRSAEISSALEVRLSRSCSSRLKEGPHDPALSWR